MFTKPCLRAVNGCEVLVKDARPGRLAKRKFCSSACSCRYLVERGIHPLQHKSLAQRRASGQKGGRVGAKTRRKAAVLAVSTQIASLMPETLCGKLSEQESALIRLLLVRAWERGHKAGMSCERTRRERVEAAKEQGLKPKRRQFAMDYAFLVQQKRHEAAA
jgi:hypothetical protein